MPTLTYPALLSLMRHSGWSRIQDWRSMDDGGLLRMQGAEGPHIGVGVRCVKGAAALE